jgi:hypothetical protein
MSLNCQKHGIRLCEIQGGKFNKEVIYVSNDITNTNKIIKPFEKLKIDDGVFQQIINPKAQRTIWYVVGPSGAGKSTYVRKLCQQWVKTYPTRPIYMFSSLEANSDESLAGVPIQYIKIGNNLLEHELEAKDFSDSLILMDDVDVVENKELKTKLFSLLNQFLEIGRHFNISVVLTSHLSTGPSLKKILNEAHFVVFFFNPTGGCKYMLEKYCGLTKQDLLRIKQTRSRWCCVQKTFPQTVICEKQVFLLADEDLSK